MKNENNKILIISNNEKSNAFLNLQYNYLHISHITFYTPANKELVENDKEINAKHFIKSFLGLKDIGLILNECEKNDVLIVNNYISNNKDSNISLKIIIYEIKAWGIFIGLSMLSVVEKTKDNSQFIILLNANEFKDFFKVEANEESIRSVISEYGFVIVVIGETFQIAFENKYFILDDFEIREMELAALLLVHVVNYFKFKYNNLNYLKIILRDRALKLGIGDKDI